MKQSILINFDEEPSKKILWGILKRLKGRHRLEISRFRPRRSDRQNAWYWGVIMPLAAQALHDTQGGEWDSEAAHEFMKGRYLAEPIIDRQSGELLSTRVRSSAVLDTKEFSHYCEQVRQWLGEYCGIDVPDPDSLGIRPERRPAKRKPAMAGGGR